MLSTYDDKVGFLRNFSIQNQEEFKTRILNSEKPVAVLFWAEWCAPCREFANVIKTAMEKSDIKDRVRFVGVNGDEFPQLMKEHGRSASFAGFAIPALAFFAHGQKSEDMLIGGVPLSRFEQWVKEQLKRKPSKPNKTPRNKNDRAASPS